MLFIVAAGLELQRSPESMKDETDHDQQRLIGVETPRAEPLASTSGQNRFPGS